MMIDAVNEEVSDYVSYFDPPKGYLLPFSRIEAALRIECKHLSKRFSGELIQIVIPPDPIPVERFLEERGFRFADNPYVNPRDFTYAHADVNQPEIILCKNIFKKAVKGVKKGAKKLGKNVVSVAKHGWHEVTKAAGKACSWVKEHKTELIIGAVVVAAVAIAILVNPAAGAAAAAPVLGSDDDEKDSRKNKEPSPDPSSGLAHLHTELENRPSSFELTPGNGPTSLSEYLSPPLPTSNNSTSPTPPSTQNSIPAPGEPLNFENYHYRPWENPFPTSTPPTASEPQVYAIPPSGTPYTPPSSSSNIPVTSQPYHAVVDPTGPVLIYSDKRGNCPQEPSSHIFVQPGKQLENKKFYGLHGVGNFFEDAQSHTHYFQKLTGGYEVNWLYKKTDTLPIDVIKAGAGLIGHVSPEALMLRTELINFHHQHLNNPEAKCFISCHSGGAVDVKNALIGLSGEVQQRVIVIAIAPAVVVPKKLCYNSFNYASKKDPIPHLYQDWLGGIEFESSVAAAQYQAQYKAMCEENRKELILLEPHPDSTGFGHEYQDPTFTEVLKHHATEYVNGNINMMPYNMETP